MYGYVCLYNYVLFHGVLVSSRNAAGSNRIYSISSLTVYHALYLMSMTCIELIEKLAMLFNAHSSLIVDVHLLESNGIRVLVTDEVIQNMKDTAQYIVEVLKSKCEPSRAALSYISSVFLRGHQDSEVADCWARKQENVGSHPSHGRLLI